MKKSGVILEGMIIFFSSITFQFFPTQSHSFSTIVSDQNTVGSYIGPHRLVDRRAHELPQLFNKVNASCVYVQARRNG